MSEDTADRTDERPHRGMRFALASQVGIEQYGDLIEQRRYYAAQQASTEAA